MGNDELIKILKRMFVNHKLRFSERMALEQIMSKLEDTPEEKTRAEYVCGELAGYLYARHGVRNENPYILDEEKDKLFMSGYSAGLRRGSKALERDEAVWRALAPPGYEDW